MLDVVIKISAADDGGLLADCSLEVAGKDVDGLEHAPAHLPPGTRFEVAFVDSEDLAARMRTARAIMRSGFVPVPVIAARRLESQGRTTMAVLGHTLLLRVPARRR